MRLNPILLSKTETWPKLYFSWDYIKAHEPPSGFDSAQEVLDFIKNISQAWAASVEKQPEVYKRLNTYVPMWAIHTQFNKDQELSESMQEKMASNLGAEQVLTVEAGHLPMISSPKTCRYLKSICC